VSCFLRPEYDVLSNNYVLRLYRRTSRRARVALATLSAAMINLKTFLKT